MWFRGREGPFGPPLPFFLTFICICVCVIYSPAIRFYFFSFFWDVFFFCAASSLVLGSSSFSIRIISMWQGGLTYGLI